MDAVSSEEQSQIISPDHNENNGRSAPINSGWPVPEFKHNLGDNPLWPEFLNELKAQREADIAESNRLADLELEKEETA